MESLKKCQELKGGETFKNKELVSITEYWDGPHNLRTESIHFIFQLRGHWCLKKRERGKSKRGGMMLKEYMKKFGFTEKKTRAKQEHLI